MHTTVLIMIVIIMITMIIIIIIKEISTAPVLLYRVEAQVALQ